MRFTNSALLTLLLASSVEAKFQKQGTKPNSNLRQLAKGGKGGKVAKAKGGKGSKAKGAFNRASVYPVCSHISETCNDDTETVAETVAVSPDGMTIYYSDSEYGTVGGVDITDPSSPTFIGIVVSFTHFCTKFSQESSSRENESTCLSPKSICPFFCTFSCARPCVVTFRKLYVPVFC